jgi:hypothetical protein
MASKSNEYSKLEEEKIFEDTLFKMAELISSDQELSKVYKKQVDT